MTNPRNPEQDDQELSQEQLKDAAGGIAMSMPNVRVRLAGRPLLNTRLEPICDPDPDPDETPEEQCE